MRWVSSGGHGEGLGSRRDRSFWTSWWGRLGDRLRRPVLTGPQASPPTEGSLVPSGQLAAISGVAVLVALVILAMVGTPHQLVQDLFSRKVRGPALERPGMAGAPVVERLQSVLTDTEQVWGRLQAGYVPPKLVFFDNSSGELACGFSASAAGPFYCPADRRIYVDLSFVDDLQKRYGAQSASALAFLVAHEVGHHIQNTSGLSGRIAEQRATATDLDADQLAIRQELQADCYAGIWAHHSPLGQQGFAVGEMNDALTATATVGGETILKRARGYVVPEDFTHGTSLQRAEWFRRGLSSGQTADCNAFEAQVL
jgi:predicted metalloprotease